MQRRGKLTVGFNVGFVVYRVAVELAFLRVLRSFLASIIPSAVHARLSAIDRV